MLYFFCIFFSFSTFACFVPPASWEWSEEKLIACSKSIVIAQYNGKKLLVKENLKGKNKKGQKLSLKMKNNAQGSNSLLSVNPDCSFSTNLKKGETYVVVQNALNPKAYQKYSDSESKNWVQKIKQERKAICPEEK